MKPTKEIIQVRITRRIIEDLANEYIADPYYHRGLISGKWVERVTDELNLKNLSDLELSDMWHIVYLTLDHCYRRCNVNVAMNYLDAQSAFTEVVNAEARRRRGL